MLASKNNVFPGIVVDDCELDANNCAPSGKKKCLISTLLDSISSFSTENHSLVFGLLNKMWFDNVNPQILKYAYCLCVSVLCHGV